MGWDWIEKKVYLCRNDDDGTSYAYIYVAQQKKDLFKNAG